MVHSVRSQRHLQLVYHVQLPRVKLVQWSPPGIRRGRKTKMERLHFCPNSYLIQEISRWLTSLTHHMFTDCNTHTCRHRDMSSRSFLSPSFFCLFFSEHTSVRARTHTLRDTHTLVRCKADEQKADVGSVSSTGSRFGRVIRLAFLRGDGVRKS